MKRYSFASLGALTILVGVLGAGCSNGPRNLCVDNNVRCQAPESCDPADGICKCGGAGGVMCGDNSVCTLETNTCQSIICGDVTCGGGTACDINDSLCKCGGTGGEVCGTTQVCDPLTQKCVAAVDCSSITCPANETCDPVTGSCVCGPSACAPGETCVDVNGTKTCAEDRCSGVTCVGSSTCDPADGFCKCNGAICKGGEACECPAGADGGCAETARVCKPGSACTGKVCGPGLTCDPADGQCKCGGPGGPICSSVQVCDLGPPPQCQGGQQCQNPDGGVKVCASGTSCDPEDGLCKCGGRGGTVCAPETEPNAGNQEICVSSGFQQACRMRCNPNSPLCPAGQFCYFDSSSTSLDAYCVAPAEEPRVTGQGCGVANHCFENGTSRHCAGLSSGGVDGICRWYCDTTQNPDDVCPRNVPHTCIQINGAPAGVGYCRP